MGKKKKAIRKSFADWDDITPEEQIMNANAFYNINEDNAKDILNIGNNNHKDPSGLDDYIVNQIKQQVSNISIGTKNLLPADDVYEERNVTEEDNGFKSYTPIKPEDTSESHDPVEIPNPEYDNNLEDHKEISVADINAAIANEPFDEEEFDKYEDVRKFGATIRKNIGVIEFDDRIASFSMNIYNGNSENKLQYDVDGLFTDQVIDLLRTALIVKRFPSALYKQEELIDLFNGNNSIVNNENESVIFVDVLGEYIAVYLVYHISIDRVFSSYEKIWSSTNISSDDFWIQLAQLIDNDDLSFINTKEYVDIFYNSSHNTECKGIVMEYLREFFVEESNDENAKDSLLIVSRDAVEEQLTIITDTILDSAIDNMLEDTDDNFDGDDDGDEAIMSDDENENINMLKDAINRNIEADNNSSMKVQVIHKGQE